MALSEGSSPQRADYLSSHQTKFTTEENPGRIIPCSSGSGSGSISGSGSHSSCTNGLL